MGGSNVSKCCDTKKDDDVTIDVTKAHVAYDTPPQDEVKNVTIKCRSCNNTGVTFMGAVCTCGYAATKIAPEDTKGEEENETPKDDIVAPIVAPKEEEIAFEPVAESKEKSTPQEFQDRTYAELKAKVGDKIINIPANTTPRRPSSDGTSLQNYVNKHESDTWTSLKAMEAMDGWNLKKEEDGIKIYVKQEKGSALMSFKAITEIECDISKLPLIILELLEVEKRPNWDKMCVEARTVESYAPYYRVSYVKLLPPSAIVAPRDLCNLSRIRFEEDGGVMMSLQNIAHPEAPLAGGHVRAEVAIGGYIFRPMEGNKGIRMVYCGKVDPKGWLPTWVANLVAWKQGLALGLFKKSLHDAGIFSK